MRVTNEQVQKIRTTSYNFRDQVTGVTTVDIATDLLDARELIDKQEALIKEMIEYIHDTVDYTDSCDCPTCVRTRTILEKTKEYAE